MLEHNMFHEVIGLIDELTNNLVLDADHIQFIEQVTLSMGSVLIYEYSYINLIQTIADNLESNSTQLNQEEAFRLNCLFY